MPTIGRMLLFVSLAALNGCVGEDRAPGVGGYATSAPVVVPTVRPCEDGETKTCSNYMIAADGVVDCFQGVRRCQDREWGACGDVQKAGGSEDGAVCALDERGISSTVSGDTASVRLARKDGGAAVSLAVRGVALGEFAAEILDSSREFHVAPRPASFALRRGADVVPIVAVRIDGRLSSSCDGFAAIAVVLTVADSAGGGSVVLTGATEDK